MLRRNLHTILVAAAVAAATAAITAGGPALARSMVDFARNAGHVDGRSAVGARADTTERARKLVATDSNGYLPNDIIKKAPEAANADALSGKNVSQFATICGQGAVVGSAQVPVSVGSDWQSVQGYGTIHLYGGPLNSKTGQPAIDDCSFDDAYARRVAVGTFEVALYSQAGSACGYQGPQAGSTIPALVTVNDERALTATYVTEPQCDPNKDLIEKIQIRDANGVLTDAAFTIATLETVTIEYP